MAEEDSGIQAKGRGAIRTPEPKVDEMDAQAVLSLLLRTRVSHTESGLLVGGGRQSGGSEAEVECGAKDEGGRPSIANVQLYAD